MSAESQTPEEQSDPLIGTDVNGTYRVLRMIGGGGMGTIYEVAHVHLPKRFALKVMLPEVSADAVSYERFRREAVTTSSLGNPHIAEVVDFNILPDGSPFMVMEYLEGEDLGARLHGSGRLETAQVAQLVDDVGSALSAAHAQGILHRDIKPGNIFLARTAQGAEVVKLLDFGAAKSARGSDLTARGQVVGTPWYMSPEQARGQELDPRSDEFSLAVVAYEALSGRLPFEGTEPVKVLFKIVGEAPIPLSTYGIPREAEKAIDRALAKDRAARFPSVADFAQALHAALLPLGAPVEPAAYPGPRASTVVRRDTDLVEKAAGLGRDWRPMLAIALGAAGVLGVGAYLLWGRSPPVTVLPAETIAVSHPPPVAAAPPPAVVPSPGIAAAGAKPTQVAVDTDPPGAAISVDGAARGAAPVTLSGLSLGPHTIIGHRADRADVTRNLTLDAPGQSMEILLRFPLPPSPAPARVEPPERRPAPSARATAAASAPRPPPAPAPKAAATMGKLTLDTTPWTTVSENGVSLGETPLAAVPLPAGTHRLRLVNPEQRVDQTVEVTIAAEKTTVTKLHF